MDNFLITLGNPGRYQMIAFFLLWSNTYPIAFNNFVMVFYGIIPEHHCKSNPETSSVSFKNITLEKCFSYISSYNESITRIPCQNGWEYDPNIKDRSIVAEWDLVCNNKWQMNLGISFYFLGVMFGGLLGGYFADRFGRQPIILICIYLQTVLGISTVFITNYIAFTAVRFIQAILIQALQACSFALIMEMFPPKIRAKANSFYSLSWTSGIIVVALIAWALDKWRHVQLLISVPSVISFLYFWFIPESMRWLITHKKDDRAEALAIKISKFNQIKLTNNNIRKHINQLSLECSKKADKSTIQRYGLIDLLRTPQVRKYTLINAFIWFTASVITYGISYGLSSIASNVYLSIIISGCTEIPLRGLSFLFIQKFGRRRPVVISLALSGLCCIIVPLILHFAGNSNAARMASTVAAIIGKTIIGFTYSIIPIYVVELYPTVIRTFGQGSAVFFSRIGGIIAPQLALLGQLTWKPTPFLICGIFGIIAALLTLILPDTHHRTLPDMIEDVEMEVRRKSLKLSDSQILNYGTTIPITSEITNGFIASNNLSFNEKPDSEITSNNVSTIELSRL